MVPFDDVAGCGGRAVLRATAIKGPRMDLRRRRAQAGPAAGPGVPAEAPAQTLEVARPRAGTTAGDVGVDGPVPRALFRFQPWRADVVAMLAPRGCPAAKLDRIVRKGQQLVHEE